MDQVRHGAEPTPQQIRRALARAERGAALDVAEATALLAARGERARPAVRRPRPGSVTRACVAAGRPGVVTYSPKVFIPLTRLCRDRCHYCTFVDDAGHWPRATGEAPYLSPDEILEIARQGAELGCLEALFTLGDRPEDRWPEARAWLDEQGYDSTLAYVRAMAIRVLEETGLLPHLNPGVMSWEEMNRLKPVAPSMGMMLETTSRRLFEEKGEAHFGSPDKDPEVRLRVLEDAGRLSVPFTTGLLVGIGETLAERAETIFALRARRAAYGAIQEVIVQNFRAKPDTAMRHADDLGSRSTAPPSRSPASCSARRCGSRRRPTWSTSPSAGRCSTPASTTGAGSPRSPRTTSTPSAHGRRSTGCARSPPSAASSLRPRLTAHPEYVRRGRAVAGPAGLRATSPRWPADDGLARPASARPGCPGRSPTAASSTPGRPAAPTCTPRSTPTGRTADRRSDFDAVYGDWEVLRDGDGPARSGSASGPASARPSTGLCRAAAAEQRPGGAHRRAGARADDRRGRPARAVCRLADDVRRDTVGDDVTYVVNRNINFTNVCYVGCRFCAFAQRRTDADAYSLSLDEVGDRAEEAGHSARPRSACRAASTPSCPARRTSTSPRRSSAGCPGMHVHAFSPMEVMNGAARTGMSIEDFLLRPGRPASTRCPARRRRSSTTRCAGS